MSLCLFLILKQKNCVCQTNKAIVFDAQLLPATPKPSSPLRSRIFNASSASRLSEAFLTAHSNPPITISHCDTDEPVSHFNKRTCLAILDSIAHFKRRWSKSGAVPWVQLRLLSESVEKLNGSGRPANHKSAMTSWKSERSIIKKWLKMRELPSSQTSFQPIVTALGFFSSPLSLSSGPHPATYSRPPRRKVRGF